MRRVLARITAALGVLCDGGNAIYLRGYLAGVRDYPRIADGIRRGA